MRTWVSILAGPTAAEARPLFTSSDPAVVGAALEALQKRLGRLPGPLANLPTPRATTEDDPSVEDGSDAGASHGR